jgi:hypothetical protein
MGGANEKEALTGTAVTLLINMTHHLLQQFIFKTLTFIFPVVRQLL